MSQYVGSSSGGCLTVWWPWDRSCLSVSRSQLCCTCTDLAFWMMCLSQSHHHTVGWVQPGSAPILLSMNSPIHHPAALTASSTGPAKGVLVSKRMTELPSPIGQTSLSHWTSHKLKHECLFSQRHSPQQQRRNTEAFQETLFCQICAVVYRCGWQGGYYCRPPCCAIVRESIMEYDDSM